MKREIEETLCQRGYDKLIKKLERKGWQFIEPVENIVALHHSIGNAYACPYQTAEDITAFLDNCASRIFPNSDDIIREEIKNVNTAEDFNSIVGKHTFGNEDDYSRYFGLYGCLIANKDVYYELYKECLMFANRYYYNKLMQPDIINEVKKYNQSDTVNNPELTKLLDDNGYLTVYHGHCKKTLRNSNSWTIKKEVAAWFGNRNALLNKQNEYYIVTGKVLLKDIITYIPDRNEFEVVVLNKDVKDKKKEYFPYKGELEKPYGNSD